MTNSPRPRPKFHPNAPRLLVSLWDEYPAYYRIARYLQINIKYVWEAMKKGQEPSNAEIRKLFGLRAKRLPRRGAPRKPLSQHAKWWRRLDPIVKDAYVSTLYENWARKSPNGQ